MKFHYFINPLIQKIIDKFQLEADSGFNAGWFTRIIFPPGIESGVIFKQHADEFIGQRVRLIPGGLVASNIYKR